MKRLKKLKYIRNLQSILPEELQTDLIMAVETGNIEKTRNILERIKDIHPPQNNEENARIPQANFLNPRGKTLLHLALEKNQKEMALYLLQYEDMLGFIDQPDNFNVTPLMLAIERSYGSIVKILLDKGANPHIREKKKGQSALLKAISTGNLEILEILLSRESIKNSPWILSEALHHAIREGQYEIVKLLLEKYHAPNLPDNDGSIALNWAIFGGHQAIIQLIRNHFGDETEQRKQNPDLSRYLDQCRIIKKYGHIFGLKTKIKVKMPNSKNYIHVDTVNIHVARDLKEALLEYGQKGDPSRTFQDFTKTLRDSKIKEIIQLYQDPNTPTEDRKIYLELLAAILAKCLDQKHLEKRHPEQILSFCDGGSLNRKSIYSFRETIGSDLKNAKLILESLPPSDRHEIIDSLSNDSIDILSIAILNQDETLMSMIAEINSQVNLCFRDASEKNRLGIIQTLVNRGILRKVNEPDDQGNTALHLAVLHGHHDIALFLLSQGADAQYYNRRTRETPLMIAEHRKDRTTLEILSSRAQTLHNNFANVLR